MKKKLLIAISIFVILAIGVCVFIFAIDKKPFEDLDSSEVISASVLIWPPKETVEIYDLETLVELLNNVELKNRSIKHLLSGGQSCIFTITRADGTTQEINFFGSNVIIDGVGYKATYSPCEAINQYANSLLKKN